MLDSAKSSDAGRTVRAKDIVVRAEAAGRYTLLLDEVNVHLVPGELVALIGPNGSGKSTLIRSLSRILKPYTGDVLVDDQNLYSEIDARSAARRIGVVPQDTQIAFDFTVREVVAMGRAPYRPALSLLSGDSSDDLAIVERSLARAGVALELADRAITSLSGGERQRVLIARALAQEAGILLLDEPTASLDIRHEGRLLAWLRELATTENRTLLVVLHDLNIAAQFADRVILLDHGKVVAHGTPSETLTADRIRDIYGTSVWVRKHPVTGRPLLLSLPAASGLSGSAGCHGRRIHLLGGGGSATPLLMQLAADGARLTMGALNLSDTDQEAAAILGISHPIASPFSNLPDSLVDEGIALAADAEVVVLCETPFGDGNLGTLRAADELSSKGIRTILLSETDEMPPERDYTNQGAAKRLWSAMILRPNVTVAPDAIEALTAMFAKSQSGTNDAALPEGK